MCDPWITDKGTGGKITSVSIKGIKLLRDLLKPAKDGEICSSLAVRAEGNIGVRPDDFKDNEMFRIG